MTFGELLFWIIIAILVYFALKIGIVLLIIAIVFLVIYFILSNVSAATYNPPPSYGPYYERFSEYATNGMESFENQGEIPLLRAAAALQTRYDLVNRGAIHPVQPAALQTRYDPVQNYFNEKVNDRVWTDGKIPTSTSEYCVHRRLQETGDLDYSMQLCQVPGRASAAF